MATYRPVAASEHAPNAPATSQWADAVTNNPIAIAEGASGAPKIAISQASAIAGSNSSLSFTGLGDFTGIVIHGAYSSEAASKVVTLETSIDGSTWINSTNIIDATNAQNGVPYQLSLMFDTGDLQCVYMDGSIPERVAVTLASPSDSIVAVRLSTEVDIRITAMAFPNGGRSTT